MTFRSVVDYDVYSTTSGTFDISTAELIHNRMIDFSS